MLCRILLALVLFSSNLFAADFPLWGKLIAGPYTIGFTGRFEYDYSRTFRAKTDLEGKPATGTRARPIQIAIWYPAKKDSSKNYIPYEEYSYLVGQELEFGPLTDQMKKAGKEQFISQRKNFSSASDAALQQLLQTKTAAIRDASAEAGKFPLIVYAPGSGGTSVENPVLCEYLASHGYIVASLPSMGAYARPATIDLTGFYAYMQDIEFVIGYMHRFPNVDPDRLGLIGFSMGGSADTLVQMRNFDVDAVVYLDTGIVFPNIDTLFRQSNYYNLLDLRAPQLYLTRGDAQNININFIDNIPYADTYSLMFEDGYRHVDFISDGMFTGVIPGYLPEKTKNAQQLAEFIDQYSLQFLNAHVKKDPDALAKLKKKPDDWGVPSSFVTAEFKAAAIAPPREWEFMNLIRDGKFDQAKAIYDRFKQANPKLGLFRENTMNSLGYEFLFRGDAQTAIKILALNVETFPQSANAHDSLSEAYEVSGNKQMALQYAEKGMELLASDSTLTDQRREGVKRALEQRLKKLKSTS
jgi:tetratricopeptide (TPR) repeat protein